MTHAVPHLSACWDILYVKQGIACWQSQLALARWHHVLVKLNLTIILESTCVCLIRSLVYKANWLCVKQDLTLQAPPTPAPFNPQPQPAPPTSQSYQSRPVQPASQNFQAPPPSQPYASPYTPQQQQQPPSNLYYGSGQQSSGFRPQDSSPYAGSYGSPAPNTNNRQVNIDWSWFHLDRSRSECIVHDHSWLPARLLVCLQENALEAIFTKWAARKHLASNLPWLRQISYQQDSWLCSFAWSLSEYVVTVMSKSHLRSFLASERASPNILHPSDYTKSQLTPPSSYKYSHLTL